MKRLLALLAVCILFFSACDRSKKQTETTTETTDAQAPRPLPELTPDDTDYDALLNGYFETISPNEETDFTFTAENGSATVTAYVGAGGRVRVPDRLGGVPVTAIGNGAFAEMDNLEVLVLPDTVTDFGEGILEGTTLTALRTPFPTAAEQGYLGYFWGASSYQSNNQPALRTLVCLELRGGEALPDHALFDCNDLVAVRLSESMTAVGDYAFSQCNRLRAVNTEHLISVGAHAFDACSSLRSLKFGNALEEIGFAALRDCNELTEVNLPYIGETREKNTYLGYLFGATTSAFSERFYSPYLRQVTLTEGCTALPDFALFECRSLQTLALPETLTAVGARALSGCTALKELTLPQACRSVGDAACAGCTALERVSLGGVTNVGTNAFLGCPVDPEKE
ncbi:MAG: leucine-rich repeat domain-containing protein [Clostridia bacterium]|nr:leucine-rich repeat domain-containing protein [Clostridia bacterium]